MKNRAAASLGKKGGRAKSPAKTAAVRENGKKGGRPRKPVDETSAAPCTVRPSAGHEMPPPNAQGEARSSHEKPKS
jgi:hypothetical protein